MAAPGRPPCEQRVGVLSLPVDRSVRAVLRAGERPVQRPRQRRGRAERAPPLARLDGPRRPPRGWGALPRDDLPGPRPRPGDRRSRLGGARRRERDGPPRTGVPRVRAARRRAGREGFESSSSSTTCSGPTPIASRYFAASSCAPRALRACSSRRCGRGGRGRLGGAPRVGRAARSARPGREGVARALERRLARRGSPPRPRAA